jgi:hypothetical protein
MHMLLPQVMENQLSIGGMIAWLAKKLRFVDPHQFLLPKIVFRFASRGQIRWKTGFDIQKVQAKT